MELAAWFPLGPDEPFFPVSLYGDYLRVVNVTNIRNVTISPTSRTSTISAA